jgi:D-beta-D-heptose 7-phosphate kinase/D-beta-D-heptose 1-phosphate adenosyltransferase
MSNTCFTDISVLVIGDIMLDQYYVGQVKRISPEAPVPVVHVKNEQKVPGGAANVVNNILGLSASAQLIGLTGNDIYKQYLLELFKEKRIKAELIETEYPTITKIRVIGNHQQVVRLDFEDIIELSEHIEVKVKEQCDRYLKKSNCYSLRLCQRNVFRTCVSVCYSTG